MKYTYIYEQDITNKQMVDIILHDLAAAEKMKDSPEQLIKSGYIQQVWEANK